MMPLGTLVDNRGGPRYVHAFPIRAEWDTNDGVHMVAEGETDEERLTVSGLSFLKGNFDRPSS